MENKLIKLLISIAFVFLGIMILWHRSSITNIMVLTLGLATICYAIVNFIRWRNTKNLFNIIITVVLAVCGIVLALQPILKLQIYDKFFGILLALFLIVAGVFLIKDSFSKIKRAKYVHMGIGIAVIVVGIVTLIRPSLSFAWILIGIACIIIGGSQVYEFFKGFI